MKRRRLPHDEAGQITIMLIVLALTLLLMISAVVDVSGGYLRRQAVSSLADGAALAVFDAASASAVYGGSDDGYVVIDTDAAIAAVDDYLRRVSAFGRYPGLDATVVVNGHTVTVSLTTQYELPVHVPGTEATTTIRAAASSAMPIY